jgi:hypothetical protein
VTPRAAIADVLATLTYGSDCAPDDAARYTSHVVLSDKGASVVLRIPSVSLDVPNVGPVAWTVNTPAEAVERLNVAGLWPWSPGDDPTRWWCERCDGIGGWYQEDFSPCDRCYRGDATNPPSLPALVAVASLGASSLVTAAELAGVLSPGSVVVWRVMTREALRNHHGKHSVAREVSLPLVFSREMTPATSNDPRLVRAPWPVACPFSGMFGTPDDDRRGVHRAWPALRALAALGVHLVALDASRIVLAVEAILRPPAWRVGAT